MIYDIIALIGFGLLTLFLLYLCELYLDGRLL